LVAVNVNHNLYYIYWVNHNGGCECAQDVHQFFLIIS
jgi:hypothetical protein